MAPAFRLTSLRMLMTVMSEVFFSVNLSISVNPLFIFVLVPTFQAKIIPVPGAASSSCVPCLAPGARGRPHPEHSCVFLPFVLSSWCVAPLGRVPFCFAVPVRAFRPAGQATVHASAPGLPLLALPLRAMPCFLFLDLELCLEKVPAASPCPANAPCSYYITDSVILCIFNDINGCFYSIIH